MNVRKNEAGEERTVTSGLGLIGQQLAAGREAMELDLDTLASQLHLARDVVEALETGDESRLPAPTFVRGYIRTYARRVGLDADELMAQLPDSEIPKASPLKPLSPPARGRRRVWTFPIGKVLLWLAVLGAGVALVVYGVPLVERMLSGDSASDSEEGSSLELPLSDDRPAGEKRPDGQLPLPEPADKLSLNAVETSDPMHSQTSRELQLQADIVRLVLRH